MAQYANYYDYLTGSGVIVPDTSSVLSEVQQEWKDVFGMNLSVAPETPQGRIIEMIARQRIFTLQAIAAISNMLNIDKGYGFILDDIGSLFQIQRLSATYTTTQITMGGVADTIIPIGTKLRSDDGYIFLNDREYIIGSNGYVTGEFRSEEAGDIPADVGTITTIVDAVAGLETVINNADATVGTNQESDLNFRNRIKSSLNINSMSVLSAIQSAVANVDGVVQVQSYENPTTTTMNINTEFDIPQHSIGIFVDYKETDTVNEPVAYKIAEAIYKKKTLGAWYITENWNSASATITQTAGSGLTDLDVDKQVFGSVVSDSGTYVFEYDGNDWLLDSNAVDLANYGISITGTPVANDALSVVYVKPIAADYIKRVQYIDENDNEVHEVVFATPLIKNVACTINVKRNLYTGDDLEGAVKDAIVQFLDGNNPEVDRVEIGGVLSAFEVAAAISSVIPDVFISSVTIGEVGSSQSTNVISLGQAEKLVISPENITVNIAD